MKREALGTLTTPRRARVAALVAVVLFGYQSASGQGLQSGDAAAGISGQVGVTGEAYTADGISNRRDPASILVFGRAASMRTSVRYGFQFLLATEQTGSRQTMNRISANLGYRFVRVSAGDMSPVLSRFSINGTTVRGGALEFTPGPVLVTFVGGRLRRPISEPATELLRPSYREIVYASRLGTGPSNGSHFHLVGLVARDATSSLSDSLNAPPRENVSITPDFGLELFDRRLFVGGTYTLSAFSADTRASESDVDVSSMLGFFTPRVGSTMDYATDFYARLRLNDFRVKLSYERIQPGFRSLGIWQTRSDQATIRLEPTMLLADRRVNVGLRLANSRNNLEGNRAATLKRRTFNFFGNFRMSPVTTLTAAYSNLRSLNELEELPALPATSNQKNVAQSFMIGPTFTILRGETVHVLNTTAMYQFLRDKSIDSTSTSAADFDNVTATANYSVAFSGGTSLNASAGYLNSSTFTTDAGAISLTLGVGRSFARRAATVGLTAGWSRNSVDVKSNLAELPGVSLSSTQLSLRLAGSYRLPSGSIVRLAVRGLRSSGDLTTSFRELHTSLKIEHRF